MLELVRRDGQPLDDDELEESDVILPPPDTRFVEAAAEFTGDGLIPDWSPDARRRSGSPQRGNQRSSSGSTGSSAPICAFSRSSRSLSRCWSPARGHERVEAPRL